MNEDDQKDEWDEMTSLWLKQDVEMPKDLPQKIRRKTLQMYVIFGSEALVTVFGIVAGFWLLFTKEDVVSHNFGYFAIFASIIAFSISWWIRRGIWQAKSSSTVDQVELSIKRAKASVNYSNYNLWSIPPLILYFAYIFVDRYDRFIERYDNGEENIFWIFGLVIVFIITVGIGSWIYKKKKQQELSFFTELLAQIKVEEK